LTLIVLDLYRELRFAANAYYNELLFFVDYLDSQIEETSTKSRVCWEMLRVAAKRKDTIDYFLCCLYVLSYLVGVLAGIG
jgi:hypothetical protein